MLKTAFVFLFISIVAGILGFTNVAAGAAVISKTLFAVFFALFCLLLIAGLAVQRKVVGRP